MAGESIQIVGEGQGQGEPVELSLPQETALAALREGSTFVGAAKTAGVGRATLYRWVQGNPHFRAAYNLWQREVAESARARLLKMTDKAVEVVQEALERGDEKVAVNILRATGVLRRQRAGSVDAHVLELQMQLRQRREKQKAEEGMMRHVLEKAGASRRQSLRFVQGRAREAFIESLRRQAAAREESADETLGETLDETHPSEPVSADSEQYAEGVVRDEGNNMPEQELRPNEGPSKPRLVREATEAPQEGVSHESEADGDLQVLHGWRVGMKLNGVQ